MRTQTESGYAGERPHSYERGYEGGAAAIAAWGLASARLRRKLGGVSTPPPPSPEDVVPTDVPPVVPGWRRWLMTVLSVLLLLTVLGVAVSYIFGYDFVKYFVQSAAGQRVASTSLGHAIKVNGEFAPLHLDKWVITTDSFTSTGWPGEAIGGLNTYGVRAEFDPEAVWHGVWHIKGISIEHGYFILRTPNDALKKPVPPKKPKPWWAHFLPSVFECGPMVTPDANVDFEFQGQHAQIAHAPLQADLIGKDFRYTATGGTLQGFPYLPALHIDKLRVMVTRPLVTIEEAQLSGVDPADPVRMSLHAELGQREDKTIKAIIDVTQMPIDQMLPGELADQAHGRMTGHVTWDRDQSGKDVYSDGDVDLSGASIDDLSVFKVLSGLHGNADLLNFTFNTLHLKFHVDNGVFNGELTAESVGKFALTGKIAYEMASKIATIDAQFTQLPLKVWLPSEFKPRYDGVATATMHWHGPLRAPKEWPDTSATVSINLDNTHVNNPPLMRRLLAKTKLRTPDEIDFKTAEFDFAYSKQTFQLTRALIDAPGVITANATGTVAPPDDTLDAVMTWNGLKLGNWLPPEIAEQIHGDVDGNVKVHARKWKLKDGSYGGDLQLVNGVLEHTSVQAIFARWVKDKALLKIPLTRAALSYVWSAGSLTVSDIDLRGGDAFEVKGNLALSPEGGLSGDLTVGLREPYVKSFMGLGDAVFTRDAEGLRWAHVTVRGTLKKPKQDLSSQLIGQLGSHPFAAIGLGARALSWMVGNWFGAAQEWKKAKAPTVVVGAEK